MSGEIAAMLSWTREQLRAHQDRRLAVIGEHAYAASPFYRRLWDEHGVTGADLRGVEDLRRFPIVTKRDIGASQDREPPFGEHLAVDPSELSRTHVNTGPSASGLQFDAATLGDVQMAADIGELLFRIAGVTERDVVINTRQFGFTPAGLFMQQAFEQLGANVAPMGIEDNRRLVRSLTALRPTAIESFTTQCVQLALTARELGIDPAEDWSIERLLIGGEPGGGSAAVREQLAELYGDPVVVEYYGSAEVRLAGMESPAQVGFHLAEPFTVFELLDPESLEPVDEGEEGVLVVTSLYRWGAPMIRINTEDVTTLHTGPCPTGMPFARAGKILGKRGGIVRAGGKNIYPEPLIGAVRRFAEVERFRLLVSRESVAASDRLAIEVAADAELGAERLDAIREDLRSVLDPEPGIVVECRQVPVDAIPPTARFAPIVDERAGAYAAG